MKYNLLLTTRLLINIFGYKSLVKRFLYDVNKMLIDNGLPFTIKYMKAVKLSITRYMSGKPLSINTSLVSITEGFPTKFLYLKPLTSSNDGKRLLLSLLSYTRALKASKKDEPKPNYQSITDPYKGKEYTIPNWYIDKFILDFKLKSKLPDYDNDCHYISNKSSPFGNATLSGLYGLFYMVQMTPKIIETLLRFLPSKDYLLKDVIQHVLEDNRSFKYIKTPKAPGKLSIVKDPELKMRVIAMVDYYSQWILKPIHKILLNLLNNFPCDRTFTQDPFHDWGKTYGHNFWSLDLSSATDRFPITLQQKLLSKIFDNDFAENWKELLIGREYESPEGNLLKYSVGQPMGAYSSWAAFTLTHHLVVHWAAHLEGFNEFTKYIILGDDIVINHDKVARRYIKIMNKLGVDISIPKTHVSKNTYEFAKRWIFQGREISGLPLRGIMNNINNPITIINIVVEYIYRIPSLLKVSTTTELLMKSMVNIKYNKRFYSHIKLKFIIDSSILMIRFNKGLTNYQEIRNYFFQFCKIQELNLPNVDEIYPFMDRVFSLGLDSIAEKSANSLMKYYDRFLGSFDPNYPQVNLKFNPIVHGLYQKLIQIKQRVMKNNSSPTLDLIDSTSDFRIDEPDKLVESLRFTSKQIIYLDKVWKLSMKRINTINELNYANFPLDKSQFFGARPFESYFISNLSNELDKLDLLRSGYQQPQNVYW